MRIEKMKHLDRQIAEEIRQRAENLNGIIDILPESEVLDIEVYHTEWIHMVCGFEGVPVKPYLRFYNRILNKFDKMGCYK